VRGREGRSVDLLECQAEAEAFCARLTYSLDNYLMLDGLQRPLAKVLILELDQRSC
jgi:hypothetical protein